MQTTQDYLRSHRSLLKAICAVLAVICVALFAWAYSNKAHQANIGRGSFDATTEGHGPVKNP